jgi:hypothetical protein
MKNFESETVYASVELNVERLWKNVQPQRNTKAKNLPPILADRRGLKTVHHKGH